MELKGLVTGIGSLPHKDAESALGLIFKYAPRIPFWPQLPRRDIREGMVAQFSENLPFIKISREGVKFLAPDNQDRELEIFYEKVIANDLEYFRVSPEYALGLHQFYQRLKTTGVKNIEFIKCQVTGPFTFAASLKDAEDRPLLHNPVFRQVIINGLKMKALWQVKFFREFGKKIIMFLDEPYLSGFGSAYTPLNRQEIVSGLYEFAKAFKSEEVLIGLHCCGNTDWSMFTEVADIGIISFDAFSFLDKLVLYAGQLKGFLERGGILSWGIVPTQEFSGKETAPILAGKIKEGIDILAKKGLKPDLLADNLLLSPACGLGALDASRAEAIFKLLLEVSKYFV